MNPFDNLRPMPPSPCGCAPRPWPRPVVPVPITPQMQPRWAEELHRILDGKQDAISDLDDIREGAQAGATAYQKPEDGVPKSDLAADVQASLDNADTAVQPTAIAGFVDGAEYDAEYGTPPKPTILLKHGSEVVATVDAADFVIDGMVSDVKIENGNLVITFNTDSGKQPISIPLTDIFNPANYYTKTDVDGLLAGKASKADATLTERGFSAWVLADDVNNPITGEWLEEWQRFSPSATSGEVTIVNNLINIGGVPATAGQDASQDGLSLVFNGFGWANLGNALGISVGDTVATRTALPGYQLGSQTDKPLASEAEAEALRQGKQDVLTFDDAPTTGSNNPVKSSGIWSMIWGALTALPTGFTSLYDWCVAQLAGKLDKGGGTMTGELNKRVATGWYVYENAEGIKHEGQDFRNVVLKWGAVPDPAGAAEQTIPFSVSWTSPFDGTTKTISGNETYYVAYDATSGTRSVIYEDGMDLPIIFEIVNDNGTLHLIVFYDNGVSHDLGAFATVCPAEYTTVPYVTQADIVLDNSVTKDSTKGVKSSGIWSAIWGTLVALPTGFVSLYDWCVAQLAGKASKSDATLTDASAWACDPPNYNGNPITIVRSNDGFAPSINGVISGEPKGDETSTDLEWTSDWIGADDSITLTATRAALQGYTLGSQTDKPLASEAEAEALRDGKLDKSGGTVAGTFGVTGSALPEFKVFEVIPSADGSAPTMRFGDGAGVVGIIWRLVSGYVVMDVSDYLGMIYRIALPSASGTLALTVDLLAKLDSTSAAPAFSSDSSTQYPVGSHVTYNGKLYKCTTATTGGTWVAGSWTADTMTDPDAVLDITVQNQLRVVAKDGTLLWAQGYDLASTSSATLACDATNNFTFADGATTQAFALPTAPTGKVGDFGLDIDNSANTGAATLTLTGLDSTFSVVVPEGESLNDMLAIAAGELARFYVTLSTFRVNNLPTWHIVKQVVENGGAQS